MATITIKHDEYDNNKKYVVYNNREYGPMEKITNASECFALHNYKYTMYHNTEPIIIYWLSNDENNRKGICQYLWMNLEEIVYGKHSTPSHTCLE